MTFQKAPHADLRRQYPVYRQLGAIAALGVTIAAFTVPLPEKDSVVVLSDGNEVIELTDVEQTRQVLPPPPPPAALPPPQEVPDNVEVEEDVIEDIQLDLAASIVPPAPPAAPSAPPPTPTAAPPPPPPPPVEPDEPDVFEVAEVQPTLIGGLAGLQARLTYPDLAIRAGIEGQVVVQFVVDERGNVVDPVVARTPSEMLSQAALDAIMESHFTPGQQRGRPVRVRFAVPVSFELTK